MTKNTSGTHARFGNVPGVMLWLLIFPEIIHGTDQTGVVLEGGGFDFQPLRESGHDRLAHLRGQRIDQKLLLGADTAANQNRAAG